MEQQFTKFEIARVIGARALQIAMDAPLLLKISEDELKGMRFDALKIAEIEFESGVLPISVKKPFPERRADVLKRAKEVKISDEKIEEREASEEEEIAKEGEIMTLVNPEEEADEEFAGEESED